MTTNNHLSEIAAQITRKRTRMAFLASIVGALLAVLLILLIGWLVFQQLRQQNDKLQDALETNQQISRDNQTILDAQQRTEERLAQELLEEARRNRQQLRTMRQEHNDQIRLIRGIIEAAGREELLEELPTAVGRDSPNPSPPPPEGGPDGGDKPPDQVKPTPRQTCVPAGRSDNCLPERGPP